MKHVGLLALDLDGTLVEGEDHVRDTAREALARARAAGLEVVLATGRRYRRTRQIADSLGMALPIVCLGGALATDGDGYTLHHAGLSPDDLVAAVAVLREHGQTAVAQRDPGDGGADFVVDARAPRNRHVGSYIDANRDFAQEDPFDVPRSDVLLVGSFGAADPLSRCAAEIERRHPGRFETLVMPAYEGGLYLEITATGVSKWNGLAAVADHVSVSLDRVCAVGDERNDLSMIRAARVGVAMGNAHPDVLAAADFVTRAQHEDGIAHLVERLLEGR